MLETVGVDVPGARRVFGAMLCLLIAGSLSSSASADDRLLCVRGLDVNEFDVLKCMKGDETMGLVRMLSPVVAHVEVRQIKDLFCSVRAFDAAQVVRGEIVVTTAQGEVDDCFRQQDGTCFTFSPIRDVNISCYIAGPQ